MILRVFAGKLGKRFEVNGRHFPANPSKQKRQRPERPDEGADHEQEPNVAMNRAVAAATAADLKNDPQSAETGLAARLKIRQNRHSGPTSGLASGYVQANLAILPQNLAQDFLHFCQR